MSHLIVADLLVSYDVNKVLLLRAKGHTVEEIATLMRYPRIDICRLLRVIGEICK